jgi:predicted DCC family thiol-disulfide oxidoreductase YuxK
VNQDKNLVMTVGRIRLLLVLMVVSLGLWIVFAKLVVPAVIESAYRGESWSFLNRMISGQATHPVGDYLQDWDRVTIPVLLSTLGFWLIVLVISSPAFIRRIVGEATPGTLGAIRMWTCLILLVCTLWEDLGSIARLPLEIRQPMGMMEILRMLPIGYDSFLRSEISLRAFQWVTELLLFLGVIGWHTRIVIPLSALCALVLNGILREYSGFWHQNLVPIYVLAVLSWTRCSDGWSVDRLLRIYRGQPVSDAERASPIYGWARYACWVPIALTYTAAGLSKLRTSGLLWMDPTNMRSLLYEQTLYPRKGNWSISMYLAPAPDFVFSLLALAAVAGELFFITVLFSRVARRILPAASALMHVGIIFLQNIVFLDLVLLSAVFYDFTSMKNAVARWLGSNGRMQVLYDGVCPVCRRTIRALRCLDLFGRLEFQNFRAIDLAKYNRIHALNLAPHALEKDMFVISRGRAYGGFYGYRVMALALPLLWPVVPLLFLPGISFVGTRIYTYVADHRLRCNPHCATEPFDTVPAAVVPLKTGYFLGYASGITCLAAIMLLCWVQRFESYPLTDMHMFSERRNSLVTYYKVMGHYESGVISPTYLEDTIDGMSMNGRYESLFDLCFGSPRDLDICKVWLAALASGHNEKAPRGKKLTAYEIQKWTWDFRSNALDHQRGDIADGVIYKISEGRTVGTLLRGRRSEELVR